MMTAINELLDELRKPFHPSHIVWKPGAVKGERALAMPYADLRAYMNRLDEVCDGEWEVAYEPWGEDRIICRLTIAGVTRSSTGETTNEAEKGEIGGTVAEAQAFKRAAAMFGLGRYLYQLPSGWADYDPKTRKFTEKAKAKLMGILVQHYRRANDIKAELPEIYTSNDEADNDDASTDTPLFNEFNALGESLYGEQWTQVRQRNVTRMSGGSATSASELTSEQVQKLIDGMKKLKEQRTPMGEPAQKATDDSEGEHRGSPPHERMWGQGASAFGPDWNAGARAWLILKWTENVQKSEPRDSAKQLSDTEKDLLADYIAKNLKGLQDKWRNHKAALVQSTGQPVAEGA
jgi:hypothetical protein